VTYSQHNFNISGNRCSSVGIVISRLDEYLRNFGPTGAHPANRYGGFSFGEPNKHRS